MLRIREIAITTLPTFPPETPSFKQTLYVSDFELELNNDIFLLNVNFSEFTIKQSLIGHSGDRKLHVFIDLGDIRRTKNQFLNVCAYDSSCNNNGLGKRLSTVRRWTSAPGDMQKNLLPLWCVVYLPSALLKSHPLLSTGCLAELLTVFPVQDILWCI